MRLPPRLVLEGITKRFPGVVANDDVSLAIEPGEIHALLGENGAGKTTLMEVAYGLHRPDVGRILLDGVERRIRSPREAMDLGIGMVHQHFTLVPILTVAENISLELSGRGSRASLQGIAERVKSLSEEYGVSVDPGARIEDLSVGELQRVEIMKALYREATVLILDEPTALLTPHESEQLFRVMRSLAGEGRALVFISHKLPEVLAVADRITVLRGGRVERTLERQEASGEVLTRLMVGDKEIKGQDAPTPRAEPGPVVLELRGATVLNGRVPALSDLDLEVRAGEIVGIAGVEGNGQRELTELLVGLRRPTAGSLIIDGADALRLTHAQITERGLGFIPPDRHGEGLVMGLSIEENLVLRRHRRASLTKLGFLRRRATRQMADEQIRNFGIAAANGRVRVSQLSGGNQQKVVVAREMHGSPNVIVAAQPTRGLDIAAEAFVHGLLHRHRERGAGVVLVSTNLEEILSLSDRVLVLYEGRFVGRVEGELDRLRIGMLMAGRSPEPAEGAAR